MSGTILPFPGGRPGARIGPVAAKAVETQVLDGGPDGALLDLRLVFRLAEVPHAQRRRLLALVRGGRPLVLTLAEAPTGEGKG